jgi:hypothetical protein
MVQVGCSRSTILGFLFAKTKLCVYLYGIFFSLLDRLGEAMFDNYDRKPMFTILTCQQYRKQFLNHLLFMLDIGI